MELNCPYCGSKNFAKINPINSNSNIKFVLTQIDISTNSFMPASGMPVDIAGCPDCKGILLYNENIKK